MASDHGTASPSFRASQRRPLACRECTRKKVRCDKNLPCGRCISLAISCSREVVKIKHNLVRHASEIQFLESIISDIDRVTSLDSLRAIVGRLKNRSRQLQYGDNFSTPEEAVTASNPTSEMLPGQDLSITRSHGKVGEAMDPSLLTTLEHLVWGRMSSTCFPHNTCTCKYHGYRLDASSISLWPFDISKSLHKLGGRLPDSAEATKLIHLNLRHLAWHHGCIHGPSFLKECELFWTTGKSFHPLWMALYLSILASTVFSIQNSRKWQRIVDVNLESFPTADKLFLAFVDVLEDFNYLQDVNIYAVQAILISAELAHNLGYSQLNATLFNAAVRIAESIGMHRIRTTEQPASQTEPGWQERIEMEIGRRIWCQMTIQDRFAIYFTDSHSISAEHVGTDLPGNSDDHDLVDMPRHIPTMSSYIRALYEMAEMMPDLLIGFSTVKREIAIRDQYRHVLDMDRRMRETVRHFPPRLLRTTAEDELRIPWLRNAQRSLAITSAEKIIMIHRRFLSRSFYASEYDFTRRTCVAAAKTILREHESIVADDDLSLWIHTAFCITAAIILCFEIKTLVGGMSSELDSHTAAVTAAIERLADRDGDVLAQRGVALLRLLLEQLAESDVSTIRARVIKMMDRMPAKFIPPTGIDINGLWLDSYLKDFSEMGFSEAAKTSDAGSLTMAEVYSHQNVMEFDSWFQSMFSTNVSC